jgi:DNA polymerase-3 subunit alpha
MDDTKTFELFSAAETTAIFQFESAGMKKWLKQLQSNCFEDLVAMNALYRPGPMEYIPSYINRKHGKEEVVYDHPMMEAYLKDTYGITVYQEQVMLQARALANFTRGQSDSLRKAMGKKDRKMMDELKILFKEGCKKNPVFVEGCKELSKAPDTLSEKIWKDWEAFASYAFNKSHSVCYAFIAYQTGYLKAHYPSEFMAAVLSCNLSNSDKISLFMDECNHMDMKVLGPDVNESRASFFVNKNGALRFGLTAIKGVGAGAVADILKERDQNGEFKSIFDFVERVNLQSTNKKNLEALAMAGAFDGFQPLNRAQFFADTGEGNTFIEALIKYGNKIQSEKSGSMANLFGDIQPISIKLPTVPNVPEWPAIVALEKEKSLIGIYLSAHPLDEYKMEINSFCTKGVTLSDLTADLNSFKNRDLSFAGIVTEAQEGISKNGKNFASMVLTDYNGSLKIMLFGNDYVTFSKFCRKGLFLLVRGKVSERWNGGNECEFKPSKMDLLEELASRAENVTLDIPIDKVGEEMIEELESFLLKHQGKTNLRFNLIETTSDIRIQMFSRSKSITLSPELKSYLQKHSFINFSIN